MRWPAVRRLLDVLLDNPILLKELRIGLRERKIFLIQSLYLVVLGCQYFFKDQEQVSYVAYNLGTLCVTIFWLQGLAVVWWLPHRYPMMKPLRLFIMILSAFIGFVRDKVFV